MIVSKKAGRSVQYESFGVAVARRNEDFGLPPSVVFAGIRHIERCTTYLQPCRVFPAPSFLPLIIAHDNKMFPLRVTVWD
jgi:hypothetical protein